MFDYVNVISFDIIQLFMLGILLLFSKDNIIELYYIFYFFNHTDRLLEIFKYNKIIDPRLRLPLKNK